MKTVYDIMMKCRTGTMRLSHDSRGTCWEHDFHIITWCREYSLKAANKTVKALRKASPREILSVWHDERQAAA